MLRELEEIERLLNGPSHEWEENQMLARRYLSKVLERLRCMYCHGELDFSKQAITEHYKGYIHDECGEKYSGRMDYERQHG